MDVSTGELLKAATRTVELFYQEKDSVMARYFENGMECITPHLKSRNKKPEEIEAFRKIVSKSVCGIIHKDYRVVMRTKMAAIIAGSCCIVVTSDSGKKLKEPVQVTLVLQTNGNKEVILRHIHISPDAEEKRFCIKDTRERLIFLNEEDVIYLESGHNHVIWHCRTGRVETAGTLGNTEKMLPPSFLRIQRGFIINRNHVSRVSRCFAEMDNGDVIQIPVKKYCEMKSRMQEGMDASLYMEGR